MMKSGVYFIVIATLGYQVIQDFALCRGHVTSWTK